MGTFSFLTMLLMTLNSVSQILPSGVGDEGVSITAGYCKCGESKVTRTVMVIGIQGIMYLPRIP